MTLDMINARCFIMSKVTKVFKVLGCHYLIISRHVLYFSHKTPEKFPEKVHDFSL